MKNKEELVSYWLEGAKSDLKVAEHLFESGDYHYCLFLGHLVLEKGLKALYVKKIALNPPYKHSLPLLAKKTNLCLSEQQSSLLEVVTDFNIEARYPDIKYAFYKKCTRSFTQEYFNKIKEMFKWLETLIQSGM